MSQLYHGLYPHQCRAVPHKSGWTSFFKDCFIVIFRFLLRWNLRATRELIHPAFGFWNGESVRARDRRITCNEHFAVGCISCGGKSNSNKLQNFSGINFAGASIRKVFQVFWLEYDFWSPTTGFTLGNNDNFVHTCNSVLVGEYKDTLASQQPRMNVGHNFGEYDQIYFLVFPYVFTFVKIRSSLMKMIQFNFSQF